MNLELIKKYLNTNPTLPDGVLRGLEVRANAWAEKDKECLEAKKVLLTAQLKAVDDKLATMEG